MPRARIVEGSQPSPFRPSALATAPGQESPAQFVERVQVEAYEKGLAEGRERAAAEVAAECERERAALEVERAAFADLQHKIFDLLKEELIGLVAEVASKILRERVDEGDPLIERALAAVLEGERPRGGAEFLCHPDDAEMVTRTLGEGAESRGWVLHPDSTLSRGSLLVRTESESIDARVETLLRRCIEILVSEESLV